jgi:transposase
MERLTMSKTKEILRLRWQLGLSVREAARATGASTGVVSKTVKRATSAGLGWELVDSLAEGELEARLYGGPKQSSSAERGEPDPVWIHRELRRAGVTLELLHLEYLELNPSGFRYTAFCDRYRKWLARQGTVMRQVHRAGEKCFVDYSGRRPHFIDPMSGVKVEVELFVAVLGASNLTFATTTRTQRIHDFVSSHVAAFEYFGGVPRVTVPDQLKSAVSFPCRYEPTIARSYSELGRHYGTAIVPARPRKPRDKSKVEVAVQVAQRWIVARLRNETHFAHDSLNRRIAELLEELNARPMKRMGGSSRRQLFEQYERVALIPLCPERFIVSHWSRAIVELDYHVRIDDHHYSVPYALCREDVEIRSTSSTIEVFHRGSRVASHVRSDRKNAKTTAEAHMPAGHRAHADAEGDVTSWAATVGPMCAAMVKRIIDANPYREAAVRSACGLRSLASKYGAERTEAACERALVFGASNYRPVERILKLGRDSMPLPSASSAEKPPMAHENVRGPDYYH